jgi:hypothetical protein
MEGSSVRIAAGLAGILVAGLMTLAQRSFRSGEAVGRASSLTSRQRKVFIVVGPTAFVLVLAAAAAVGVET